MKNEALKNALEQAIMDRNEVSIKEVMQSVGISQATYYVMLSDIFTYAEGLAAGLKLIPPKR